MKIHYVPNALWTKLCTKYIMNMRVHPRHAKLVQYSKFSQCNSVSININRLKKEIHIESFQWVQKVIFKNSTFVIKDVH